MACSVQLITSVGQSPCLPIAVYHSARLRYRPPREQSRSPEFIPGLWDSGQRTYWQITSRFRAFQKKFLSQSKYLCLPSTRYEQVMAWRSTMKILDSLFSSGDFMPHGYCYLWKPGLVWLHVVSDALIALAYFSIPIALIYFIRKRRDLPFNWMFLCFGTFIMACGTTHAMEVWTLWHGTYWLSGAIKAVTAIASVPTAVLLVHLVPRALALPSPEAMRLEIAERKRAQEALRKAKDELELRVQERTSELRKANEDLVAEIAQRKRSEEELHTAQAQMAHMARMTMMGELTSSIAHEVNQ